MPLSGGTPDHAAVGAALFILGCKDHLMLPSVIRSNVKKYRNSEPLTETYEFPERSHFTGVEAGGEQVADYALDWATTHLRAG